VRLPESWTERIPALEQLEEPWEPFPRIALFAWIAFYLFFLYVGSSVLGSAGGVAWSHAGWPGVALFTGVLVVIALLIAFRLVAVKPLPENMV